MPYWLSAIFAFFAIPGFYYVFCVLFGSLLVKKPYTVMIRGDGLAPSEIMIEISLWSLLTRPGPQIEK